MARIRSIKPGFFRSEDVAVLPHRARLTWVGLWTHADDAGRCKDNGRLIKGDVWPLDDDVTLADIEDDLTVLARAGRIVRYDVAGVRYIQIVNWGTHQAISKPTPSRLPAPSEGTILAVEELSEPPELLDEEYYDEHEPYSPEDSRTIPGGLPEDSRGERKGSGSGGEGKGGEVARAHVREASAPSDPSHIPPIQIPEEPNPEEPPPIRCPDHIRTLGEIPPCRACARAKDARRTWGADQIRRVAEARSSQARRHAEGVRAEIDACGLCDPDGRLAGGQLCRHDPGNADRTKQGAAAARSVVGNRPRARTPDRPSDVTAEAMERQAARRAAHQARLATEGTETA